MSSDRLKFARVLSVITSNKRFIIPLHYFPVIFTFYSIINLKLGLLRCNTLTVVQYAPSHFARSLVLIW